MSKHVIVTGGAGYIGSHTIVELLEQTDFSIISIDNFSNSSKNSYTGIENITNKSFDKIELDLCNYSSLINALVNVDDIIGVIHFAAFKAVGESTEHPIKYYDNNTNSLLNVLRLCDDKKIPNLIFSSSCSVYGNTKDLPVTEKSELQKAVSPYGHTKQIGEEIIEFCAASNKNLKSVLLRYFNPVGAHMSGLIGEVPIGKPNNLVPIITQTAAGKNSLFVHGNDYPTRDGSCIRDYIHVSDIASAHVKALMALVNKTIKSSTSVYNLGTGKGVSVLEAIHAFERVTGNTLPYKIGPRRPGDVIEIYANNEKAKTDLEWSPKFTIEDMMLSAWRWQQNFDNQS
ncbi:MAG: UDP-glucose 4-epimerase GalE [Bacteroidia bacterium]